MAKFTVEMTLEADNIAKAMNRALVMLYQSDTDADSVTVRSESGQKLTVGQREGEKKNSGGFVTGGPWYGANQTVELTEEDRMLMNRMKANVPHGEVGHD